MYKPLHERRRHIRAHIWSYLICRAVNFSALDCQAFWSINHQWSNNRSQAAWLPQKSLFQNFLINVRIPWLHRGKIPNKGDMTYNQLSQSGQQSKADAPLNRRSCLTGPDWISLLSLQLNSLHLGRHLSKVSEVHQVTHHLLLNQIYFSCLMHFSGLKVKYIK